MFFYELLRTAKLYVALLKVPERNQNVFHRAMLEPKVFERESGLVFHSSTVVEREETEKEREERREGKCRPPEGQNLSQCMEGSHTAQCNKYNVQNV